MNVLLANFIVYTITSLLFWMKFKRINLYVFLWLAYTFSAFMSFYCVSQGFYYNTDIKLGYKLSIIPYIANYLFIFIVLYPFYNFKEYKVRWDAFDVNRKISAPFINLSLFLFIIYGLFNLANSILASQLGFSEIYESRHSEGINLLAISNPLLSTIYNWSGTYYQVARTLIITLLVSKLIKIDWRSKKYLLQLSLCFLPSLLGSVASANRGGLFFLFADFVFVYLLAKQFIPSGIKKKIITTILLLLGVMTVFAIKISISRFVENGNEDSFPAIIRYFGEAMANIGDLYYGRVRNHPMGATFFPEFFNVPTFDSMQDFFQYWSHITGVPIALFGTIFGDCYIQFGMIGAFVFITIFVFLWKFLFFKYGLTNIPFIMYYFITFGIAGLFGYGFYDERKHFLFILLVLFSFSLKKKKAVSIHKKS